MKFNHLIIVSLICFSAIQLQAQEVKFGKVSKKELQEQFYPQDTTADAVVLYKKRRTTFEYNQSTGWQLKTEVHERIKFYNAEEFNYATNQIHLYTRSGSDENVTVKGYTYNLEGSKVVKTKLEKKQIFKEEINKNWFKKTFTMPNLKEGCIVEWKYEIHSPYYSNINDVICQYKIPIKYLDVHVQIPEYFEFKYVPSGYFPISMKTSRKQKSYTISQKYRANTTLTQRGGTSTEYSNVSVTEMTYDAKQEHIPALKDEPYVNNLYNYVAKVKFEFTAYKPKYGVPEYYNNNWTNVTKSIYESQRFGEQLRRNGYYKKDLEPVLAAAPNENAKILAIFEFVKHRMKWNGNKSKYVGIGGIKKAYNEREGNAAEINLMLTSMLREYGLNASPILVSTRDHGVPLVPTKEGFNYVIAGVEHNGGVILLDATEKYSIPDVLPLRDLNWEGRLIRKDGSSKAVNLYPNKYSSKSTSMRIKLDEMGSTTGYIRTKYNHLNALNYRSEKNHLSEEELISSREENLGGDIEIEKIKISNKKDIYKPVVESVQFTGENQADIINDKIYISPMLFYSWDENPFKQEKRHYPIDFGTPWKNEVNITIEIPKGYEITSFPESANISLPDNLGAFLFQIKPNGATGLKIVSVTKINSSIISQNNYSALKELYKLAIEKQMEKIVLTQTNS